jgi:hypothetical protein
VRANTPDTVYLTAVGSLGLQVLHVPLHTKEGMQVGRVHHRRVDACQHNNQPSYPRPVLSVCLSRNG